MLLGTYRIALDAIMRLFRPQILSVLRAVDITDPSARARAAPEIAKIVREARGQAAAEADDFMQAEAADRGFEAFTPPVEGYPDRAVEKVLRESRSIDEAADALERHVETAARRQIVRSVPDPEITPGFDNETDFPEDSRPVELEGFEDLEELTRPSEQPPGTDEPDPEVIDLEERRKVFPVGWARVPTGAETCPFCYMLAARGPVYTSRSHAVRRTDLRVYREDRRGAQRVLPQRVYGGEEAYHDHCDCIVVPVYDVNADWPGKDQYERLSKEWDRMRANSPYEGTSVEEWRDWVRENPIDLPNIREIAA